MITDCSVKPAAFPGDCDALFELMWLGSQQSLQTNQHNGFQHCIVKDVECWNLYIVANFRRNGVGMGKNIAGVVGMGMNHETRAKLYPN